MARLHKTSMVASLAAALLLAPVAATADVAGSKAQPSTAAETSVVSLKKRSTQPLGPTIFRLASFNLLGSGHTDGPNASRPNYADSSERIKWTRQILDQQQVGVVGFQEMHGKQVNLWKKNNPDWGLYPALELGGMPGNNSISWRLNDFRLIEARTLKIPYFNGDEVKMPYVLLEHIASGSRFWTFNVHNPANINGDHQKWRDIGFARAVALSKTLRQQHPDAPFFMTGDMNDREKFFCPTVGTSQMVAANGGYATPTVCVPPRSMSVDWIMGTAPNTFSAYTALRDTLVQQTTDHPVIMANVNIPSMAMRRSRIRRVVVVSAEGLRANTARHLSNQGKAPGIAGMRKRGSHTFNARTTVESTRSLPNLVSMLTARPVDVASLGHGVLWDNVASTVHAAAGSYVSTVFDLVHNNGLRTALISSSKVTDAMRPSWDAAHGGLDPYGRDDGRDKIDKYRTATTDRKAAVVFSQLRGRAAEYTHIHLKGPRAAGERYGFNSPQYRRAVETFDKNLRLIRRTINKKAKYKNKTLLIVASTGGGAGRSGSRVRAKAAFTVPLFITGPGVPAGRSLYAMNPAWVDPGRARVDYSAKPITTADIANLGLTALRLPPIPGSTLNPFQSLNFQIADPS